MTTPRKHHSVPQSLLRQFVADERSQRLFVFDKEQGRSIPSTPKDAGAERDFYSIDDGTLRLNWEPAFQLLDDRLAEVLRVLSSAAALNDVDRTVRRDIPTLVATQLLRTRLQRTSVASLAEQLNAFGEHFGVERIDLSDNDVRRIHLQRLLGIDEIATLLASKDFVLLNASNASDTLWISDNPVVLHNNFPYSHPSVGACGVEIYFPIGPTRCLALYCPSIAEQIRESLDPSHPRPDVLNSLFPRLLKGIEHGDMVSIGDEFVPFLNELQVRHSSRFLYSRSPNFGQAERVLGAQPSFKSVQTLIDVGEVGAAPVLQGVPPGTFLLLERGHRHDVLAVSVRTEGSTEAVLAVSVLDALKLSTIDATTPFDAATLIVDGHAMRCMREIKVTLVAADDGPVLEVRHADPAIQNLIEAIRSRRSAI